jgi:hypothetical protein
MDTSQAVTHLGLCAGDKTNNNLSNLELLLKSEHTKKHHTINTQK